MLSSFLSLVETAQARHIAVAAGRATQALVDHVPRLPVLVGGEYVEEGAATSRVVDKFTQEPLWDASDATRAVMERAIGAAERAERPMARMEPFARKEVLARLAGAIVEHAEPLAVALALEVGKPIRDARVEVVRAAETCELAGEEATRMYGEAGSLAVSQRNAGLSYVTRRFPVGTVGAVTPFNFPLNLAAHKIAPAIAAGCPFVLKPSERAPLSTLLLGALLQETAGELLPAGAFSVLPCTPDVAERMTADERVKMISFTGSGHVGWGIKARAGRKRVALELGGNAGVIVAKDANVDVAVERIVFGAFYQAGQSCVSVQRILVHETRMDEFVEKLRAATDGLKVGDPLDEDTFVGPLITPNDAVRCHAAVQQAVDSGRGSVLLGHADVDEAHALYAPTVVRVDPSAMRSGNHANDLLDGEIFGPVATLEPYTRFDDALAAVNDTPFGLQAGIFTYDSRKHWRAFEELHVGGVIINDVPSIRADVQPYGGVKESGMGREGPRYAIEDMSEIKVMVMRNASF